MSAGFYLDAESIATVCGVTLTGVGLIIRYSVKAFRETIEDVWDRKNAVILSRLDGHDKDIAEIRGYAKGRRDAVDDFSTIVNAASERGGKNEQ